MRDLDFDINGFPSKHPSGRYGMNHPREEQLTKQNYFRTRLLHYSGLFSKGHDYILMVQSFVERAAIEAQIHVSAQKGVMTVDSDGSKVMKLSDEFSIFKTVPGTPRYWQGKRNNLLAMMNSLGPFHLFYTFSCAEKRCPEVIAYLLRKQGHKVEYFKKYVDDTMTVNEMPLNDFLKKTGQTLHELIQKNTFDVTRIFDNRVKSFIKNILMGQSDEGLQITYYTYRVEFQSRGMPHIHGVAWLNNDVLKDFKNNESNEFDFEKLPRLIDRYVTCKLPDDVEERKIVETLQSHSHSKTCFKKGKKCCFGFKKLPSNYTMVSVCYKNLEMPEEEQKLTVKKSLEVKEKMRNFLESEKFNSKQSLDEILTILDLTSTEYHDALKISDRGTEIVLKRTPEESSINGYNWNLINAFQSNMDLQFCVDSYAVVSYITDYYSKDETQMTSFLMTALKDSKHLPQRERVNQLKKTYLSKRQIGLPEAIYRAIPALHLQNSNIGSIFIQSGFPCNNSKFLRRVYPKNSNEVEHDVEPKQSLDESLEENLETQENIDDVEEADFVRIAGREGNYVETLSLNDIYPLRPQAVESLTLAQFGTSYVRASPIPKRVVWEENISIEVGELNDFITNEPLPKYLRFELERTVIYRSRRSSIVLKVHVSSKKPGHEELFAEMNLFTPWRDLEHDLGMSNPEKCKALFQSKQKQLLSVKKEIYPFSINELIEDVRAREAISQFPEQIEFEFDPEGTRDNIDVNDLSPEIEDRPTTNFEIWDENEPTVEDSRSREERFKCLERWSEDFLLEETRNLASEQRAVLQRVVTFAKGKLRCQKNRLPRDSPEQLLLIVHGGGGNAI